MSLPLAEMKTTEQSDSVITINNNFKKLTVEGDGLSDHDRHSSSSNACSVTSPTNSQLEIPTLTDDTASDSPGELVTSQLSDNTEDEELREDVVLQCGNSVDYLKEKAVMLLQEELQTARKALELKDEECKELNSVRSKVEEELEELTASLFQEAHKMVNEANMKQYIAEKKSKEAKGEIEALRTEVSALKSLVLTSTPSNPNPECHPQLIKKKKDVLVSPLRKNRLLRKRSPQHAPQAKPKSPEPGTSDTKMGQETDMVLKTQLHLWLEDSEAVNGAKSSATDEAGVASNHLFLERIDHEDVIPCLTFSNSVMSQRILDNVRNNSLTIEPLSKPIMESCVLAESLLLCKHQIKCGDSDEWHPVSVGSRARIASVCDYMTYIRYIEKKIVKHSKEQMYWEINRLRKEMCLAKLGYYKTE